MTTIHSLPSINLRIEGGERDLAVLDALAEILIEAHGVASQDQDPFVIAMIENALARVGRRIARSSLEHALAS